MHEIMLKDLPNNTLPRERFISYGKENLSDEELIALLLRSGYKNVNAKVLASIILKSINGIENLGNITLEELTKIKGVGKTKAITILTSIELGKRVYFRKNEEVIKLNNAEKIYNKFKSYFLNQKQELFYVIYLDHKKNYITSEMLFKGTLDSATVHPREIFKGAVKRSASSIILMHNHPSNDKTPSINDIEFTDNINKLGKMMGISVVDHLIMTENGYFSFFENDMMR